MRNTSRVIYTARRKVKDVHKEVNSLLVTNNNNDQHVSVNYTSLSKINSCINSPYIIRTGRQHFQPIVEQQ